MRKEIIVAVCLCISVSLANAHDDTPLSGFKQIKLLIEDLSKDAQGCGVTEGVLQEAFRHAVSSAKLDLVSASLVAPTFDVSINTTRAPDNVCASSIIIDVHTLRASVEVALWTRSKIAISNSSKHGQQIKTIIEGVAKDFIAEWNLANK